MHLGIICMCYFIYFMILINLRYYAFLSTITIKEGKLFKGLFKESHHLGNCDVHEKNYSQNTICCATADN